MSIAAALMWFGGIHASAYAVAGMAWAVFRLLAFAVDKSGKSRLVLQAVGRVLQERAKARSGR
ncbi:MAG: hypothetical protein ACK5SX_15160 [Sandaracinobacter sp.]